MRIQLHLVGVIVLAFATSEALPQTDPKTAKHEAIIFTPSGFDRPGKPVLATGQGTSRLKIVIRNAKTGKPTPCRLNVVGADGNFYQPPANDLTAYALIGQWPRERGNRQGKAPNRYFGRFFY